MILQFVFILSHQMDKAKKLGPTTDNLNKALEKLLQNFSYSTQWTDIINWLKSLEAVLKDNPSPYINQKVWLSKRLNQCINPILPQKIHEQVLVIHQLLFLNIRNNVENNINEYNKLFAEDLGIYSLSILPYFTHTTSTQHRMTILKMLNDYYLDLGLQLIPMLMGIIKSILPVYNQTTDERLMMLLKKTGRRYVISSIWSCILKFSDCRNAGVKFLGKIINKMEFKKDEDEFESQHGFSQEEQQLRRQLQEEKKPIVAQAQQFPTQKVQQIKPPQLQKSQNLQQQPKQHKQNGEAKQQEEAKQHKQEHKQTQHNQGSQQSSEHLKIAQDQKHKQLKRDNLSKIKQLDEEDENTEHKLSAQPPDSDKDKDEEALQKSQSQRNLRLLATSQGPAALLSHEKLVSELSSGHLIRLDKVPLMMTPGIEVIKQGINNDNNQNNFPHHSTLVVSSLIACLEDNSQFIKRSVLDFMFTHLRIKSEVFSQNDRLVLVEAVIRLFRKKEVSVIKRINRWLLGRQNQEGIYEITDKNQFVIPYIVSAFKKILDSEPADIQSSTIPLKIIQNFYMEHSHLIDKTISNISVDLLRYVFNYSTGQQYSEQIIKAGNRFFSNIPSHYPLLFKSLGDLFVQGIRDGDDHLAFQCIRYIDYCYIKLMKHEHGIEELQYITITLLLLTEGLKQFATHHTESKDFYKTFLRDTTLLVYNLISRRQSVERYMSKSQQDINKKYLQETGKEELPAQRIQYQRTVKSKEQQQKAYYVQILQRMEFFFGVLGQIIKKTPNIQIFEDIYKLSSMTMVKLQMHLPSDFRLNQLPAWFSTIQYGIRVQSPTVSLAAIEALIKCLMFEDKHPTYAQIKLFTMEDKSKKVGSDYQQLALQKLWALLDYPHMHSKIIDLIVAFSKFFPNQFTETVKRSFQTHSDPEKEASIQRFSHFWRLTGFKYKDLLISNRQFAQLNKVGLFKMLDFLDDQNPLVRHAAKNWMTESMPLFYRVLQPLFYELMKVGGDWYTTPKGLLIIRNNYDTSIVFSTFRRIRSLLANGTFAFLRYVYQQPISDRLQEMRDKVTTLTTSILTQNTKQKQALPMVDPSMQKQPVLPKALEYVPEVKQKRMAYIDLLIILCVKFVQGVAIESMGLDFYTGNAGVNTSAIQLLESMINYLQNPSLCAKLINYIMQPLCKVLNQAVTNQEYITQIQLLNLLKTIFFNSSFRMKGTVQQIRTFFKSVFTKKFFLQSMLNGLHTPFAYVRAQFINFITSCIELIANFLDPDQCTECIKHILFNYYKIIKQIRVSLIQQVLDQEDKSLQILNQIEDKKKRQTTLGLARIVQMQIKAKQQQKLVKLSNNLQQVAKTNQILSILHGVSAILNYFYDLDKINLADMKFQMTNPYTIFDSVKSIITLGFASSQKLGKLVERTQFLHNVETAQSILKDLSPVYQTILRAWPLSEQFVRIATQQFTSIGSRNFNFEKFSRYNKVLIQLINFVSKEKQTIWGKIFSILKPMFYRFPRDIMEIYLKLWTRQCTNAGQSKGPADFKQKLAIRPSVLNTQFLMKILETIIVSNFPMDIIVHAFLQTSMIQQIRNFYMNKKKDEKSAALVFHISQLQAKLLYFLYSYFMYSYIQQKQLNKENLLNIWSVILKAVRPFVNSTTPTTSIWVLDVINMCAVKYSPKQILTNQKFKTDLHGVVNQLLKQVAAIASKKIAVFYDDPTKAGFNQMQGTSSERFRIVLPIAPSLYEIFKTKQKDRLEIDKQLFIPVKVGDNVSIEKINRLWCFKTLKKLGYQILQNTYLTQKTHFAVIRACQWMEMILPTIQDKSTENMIYAESASEVLYGLLEQARILFIKPLKTSIIRIFDKDDFFICNKNTLNYWAKIIDWVVSIDKNNQTFTEYLSKVSLSSSFFTSESSENKKRIKSFERICFILYSGQQDKYAFKIKGLLQKIADVIKTVQTAHPALLILILFSIRILIFRLSQISLNQLFIDIWPMILAFLMQIFSKKLVKVELANQISRNPNLLLAAIKLIQMISISNLSSFAHHQWIFIYDYFGLKISLTQGTVELGQILSERPQLTELVTYSRTQTPSPFFYKPYMYNYLSQHSIQYRSEDKKHETIEYEPKKRIVIVKNSFVRTEDQLKAYVYLLAQYLVRLNQYRIDIETKQIQQVIINDFIKLDSFIHKI